MIYNKLKTYSSHSPHKTSGQSSVGTAQWSARMNTATPPRTPAKAATPGAKPVMPDAPFAPPWLVPPEEMRFLPLCPFDVARTDGSTVTVFAVFVTMDVANVCGAAGSTAACAASEKRRGPRQARAP
ncbi:uncharacterized protein TRAVEDRAFT_49228 [Trametes versicolor FP-101664 SS1]|uniref:uncharacterized protein n=1 Tax=Trametes versicolor (strain FP-101664) TaxID=717944 RepID=UPI000462343E|nr:uncharacterized protein TRAVEDRAFT_49228 [Trametes versicolor FP-101664 SS1]EIW56400.1 hypothetical protein TRAVEDRAFT_49228 [Trametes versicolor FP-101664 SS1]